MRLLIDANLSPRLLAPLRTQGFDTTHVSDIGLATATDSEIFDHAVSEGSAIVTADSDFAMLLALRRSTSPSVIQLRHVAELGPDDQYLCSDGLPPPPTPGLAAAPPREMPGTPVGRAGRDRPAAASGGSEGGSSRPGSSRSVPQ